MDITVRRTKREDKKDLINLFEDLSQDTKKILTGSVFGFQESVEFAESALDRLTESFVILIDENIIGEGRYVYLLPGIKIIAEIGIVISDSYQGNGFGRILLSHLMNAGLQNGVRKFVVYVDSRNLKALRFFRKSGFNISDVVLEGNRTLYFMTRYLRKNENIILPLPEFASALTHP